MENKKPAYSASWGIQRAKVKLEGVFALLTVPFIQFCLIVEPWGQLSNCLEEDIQLLINFEDQYLKGIWRSIFN